MRRFSAGAVCIFFVLTAAPRAQTSDNQMERTRALHEAVPLIDGHNDYPIRVREMADGDLPKLDITQPRPDLMTDFARLREGGVGGQFWSVFVPASMQGKEAVRATMEQIDIVHRMVERWPDALEIARTADDVERVFAKGMIASLIGMEGGHSIDSSLGTLRMFHRLGARYMTLTHGRNTPWADSSTDEPEHGGLTSFGEAVVQEMNWLGMLVDLSHVSPDTMKDALRVAAAPVIYSHSSARAVCDVPRNVPDDVLKLLPENGGVVMVTFVPGFLSEEVAAHGQARTAEAARLRSKYPYSEETVTQGMDAWRRAHPAPRATVSQIADHVDHIRDTAGIDHIGIGSDFDGIGAVPQGMEDVSKFPALTAELLRRGYGDEDVKKILGLNVLRVMRRVEEVSGRLRSQRPPSAATIEELDGYERPTQLVIP